MAADFSDPVKIEVIDTRTKEKADFTFSQQLLGQHMKFFEPYLLDHQ